MDLSDGGDYLEFFGNAGHGKSRLLAHIAIEAKRAGKKVLFLDCEHSVSDRIKKELGDGYRRIGFMNLEKIIEAIATVPKGYDLICFDSIGFPVLIRYAEMDMRQRGDAILKTILLRGHLKNYAETNK
jgi:RecA/RadA recombinase